jgi:hypothetical protein
MKQASLFSMDQVFVQGEGNIVSNMGGSTVMLNIENGKYYNLGVVGGEIWNMAESPITGYQIVQRLLSDYRVEKIDCEEQVAAFLEHMAVEGLLSSVEQV